MYPRSRRRYKQPPLAKLIINSIKTLVAKTPKSLVQVRTKLGPPCISVMDWHVQNLPSLQNINGDKMHGWGQIAAVAPSGLAPWIIKLQLKSFLSTLGPSYYTSGKRHTHIPLVFLFFINVLHVRSKRRTSQLA